MPVQRALLRTELEALLFPPADADAAPSGGSSGGGGGVGGVGGGDDDDAPLASAAVREAYARAVGSGTEAAAAAVAAGEGQEQPATPHVLPRPLQGGEVCAVCFDELEHEAASDVLAEAEAEAAAAAAAAVAAAAAAAATTGGLMAAAVVAAPAAAVAAAAPVPLLPPTTTHCAIGCGRQFHAACLTRWFAARADVARAPECPACRAHWRDDDDAVRLPAAVAAGAAAAAGAEALAEATPDEGFLNLGTLQPGTRVARDSSSYSEWLELHQRRREQAALAGGSPQPQPSPRARRSS